VAKRLLLPPMIRAFRKWDEGASRYPDHFVANSKTVAARIERAYGRTAEVIHPPIDVNRFRPSPEQEDYYLVLARLISLQAHRSGDRSLLVARAAAAGHRRRTGSRPAHGQGRTNRSSS
jgi:glycosyltransferase involved in cell wall biosynthesis